MVANAATLMSLAPLIGPLIGAAFYVQLRLAVRPSRCYLAFSLLLACTAACSSRRRTRVATRTP